MDTSEFAMITKSKNTIIADHGDWIEVDVSTKTHPDAVMKIDKHDALVLFAFGKRMYADRRSTHHATVYVSIDIIPKHKQLVHRVLLPDAQYIDHADHDGTNNRRSNLRGCTHSQNLHNRPVQINNELGHKGISKRKDTGKYVARLVVDGVKILREEFSTLEDAIGARKKAEEIHICEFSYKG
jgi:hypothetical protein